MEARASEQVERAPAGDRRDFVDCAVAAIACELPELETRPILVGARILRLAGALRRRLDAALAPTGVRSAGFGVLAALRRSGEPYELIPSALSRETLLTSGAMTNRIDRLEDAGLVERRRDSGGDRRTVLIRLTPAGKELVETAFPVYLGELERLVEGVSASARAGLERGLRAASLAAGDTCIDSDAG